MISDKYGIIHLTYSEKCPSRAIFAVKKRLTPLKQTPPPITIKLFDSLVHPVIEYSSKV